MLKISGLSIISLFAHVGAFYYDEKKINCYFGSWAVVRTEQPLELELIDPQLCTHLSCVHFDVASDGTLEAYKNPNDDNLVASKRAMTLKSKNPQLKVIAVVGGPNTNFIAIATNRTKQAIFKYTTLRVLTKYGFDGLDLFWPSLGVATGKEMKSIAKFLISMKYGMKAFNLTLGASLNGEVNDIQSWSKIPNIYLNYELDYINVMAYNFSTTIYHAPLYGNTNNTVENSMQVLSQNLVSASARLLLGVAFIGQAYQVSKGGYGRSNVVTLNARSFKRYVRYLDMCTEEQTNDIYYADEFGATFIKSRLSWTSYESVKTVVMKAEYAQELGLGGIAIWLLDDDDFLGRCGKRYPLLRAIHKTMNGPKDYDKL
ncbi:chitinase-3-like protein 1 [Stomoxys calcitrans]|uniref:chitinase-3-like protein 1 n=1 Tax=Stomoxys calcitrans TaxID=35570 RepID=UPI0027E2B04B|nr:chitinase-3-like protein 1 [Stomoxys calcitrans]